MRKLLLIFSIFLLMSANAMNLEFFSRFNDCYLEKYILEAYNNNHDLKAINHRIEQFRAEISNQLASELPTLSIGSNYLGTHFPAGDRNIFIKRNSYVLPVIASYEPDFWLKNRDKTRSKKKLYKAQIANQKATYISLLTDVANTYLNILLYDYLIKKQTEIVKDKEQNVNFNKNKYTYGVISFIDLNDIWAELYSQKTVLDNLIKQQKQTLYNFSTLLGRSAYNSENILRGKLEEFEYNSQIPKTIEPDIVSFRPDLIELENQLKSARIDVRVARKEFLPKFNITGVLAFDTAGGGNFFNWDSSFAYLIAGLTQDIFKGGEKFANLKIAKAKYCELFEKYLQADLNAIKEIINALNFIEQDLKAQNNSKTQLDLERKNFIATSRKLRAGTASKIEYLQDKNAYNQREQLFAYTRASRLADYFTLYKAVGGQL